MRNLPLSTTIFLSIATTTFASQAQAASGGPAGFWNWSHVLFGHLPIVVLWLAAILLATRRPGTLKQEAALDMLRQRYARGEINTGEFEERRRFLSD